MLSFRLYGVNIWSVNKPEVTDDVAGQKQTAVKSRNYRKSIMFPLRKHGSNNRGASRLLNAAYILHNYSDNTRDEAAKAIIYKLVKTV